MTGMLPTITDFTTRDPIPAGIIGATALLLVSLAAWSAGKTLARAAKPRNASDLLTVVAASMASAVAMTGMWAFAGRVLHFSGMERVLLFAFLEVTAVTCAVRARRNLRESAARAGEAREGGEEPERVSAGIEGPMIWVISALSGVFSSLNSRSGAEAAFRLAPPLIAAWLWERSLSTERRRLGDGAKGYLRQLADRVLVRLGMAEPGQRTVGEAAARWRIHRLARAVVRARRGGRALGSYRRRRVYTLTVAANDRADLATDAARQELLLSYIGSLRGAEVLMALKPPAPWDSPSVKLAWEASRSVPQAVLEAASQTSPEHAPSTPEGDPEDVPQARSEDIPERASDSPGDAPEARPGTVFEHASGPPPSTPGDRPQARRRPALKLAASKSRSMSAADLMPHVKAMLGEYGSVSMARVKSDLHIGSDKAAEALRLAIEDKARSTVTPINRAMGG